MPVAVIILLLLLSPLFTIVAGTWTAVDAARRGRNWFAWGVAVSVTGVAFFVWLVARRRFEKTGVRRSAAGHLAFVLGLLFMAGLSLLLARNVSAFLLQVARVEGQAMSPTLNDQDRLIVDKTAYRIGEPRRGDIVMLYYPLNPHKQFVKRVIAEEGDQIRISGGHVFLNDVPMEEGYVAHRSRDTFGPVVVPEGYYFVMGDRRNNSSDSRHWGYVPKKYILGRVVYRWWPFGAAGSPR